MYFNHISFYGIIPKWDYTQPVAPSPYLFKKIPPPNKERMEKRWGRRADAEVPRGVRRNCQSFHIIRAYALVPNYHSRRAGVSPHLDFVQNAFGFHRIEGANQYEAQNRARAKREGWWWVRQKPKNSKGFPTIFSEINAEPFGRGGGLCSTNILNISFTSQSFSFVFTKEKR